ncbi:N-acetylneuraminate 9-O-acetyltransferase [Cimex lectularius]|uniref:Cas1p 10 TM acyl transferase domain-containing protein n=1 Tax=Cimex lectularius TaxID=79782 RepID=A0A8I6RZS4_CIMLE|nr:N-acetylneuraminate 9-O-acetyltransferase [Cimex lectularius]
MPLESDGANEFLLWEGEDREKSVDVVKQINAKNAKYVAVGLVVGFILYHGIVHLRYGTDSCKWLLSGGKYKGDMEWQPYGCMMHQYSQLDTRRCIRYLAFFGRHNHFIFIGDNRVLEIYKAFLNHLIGWEGGRTKQEENKPQAFRNHSVSDSQLRVTVDFIWSPYVSDVMVNSFKKWKEQSEPPSLIVAGCGNYAIKRTNGSSRGVKEYALNLTRIVAPIDSLNSKKSRVLWILLEPVNEDKVPEEWAALTNRVIDQYNWAAREALYKSGAQVWSSTRMLVSGNDAWDGLHIPVKALRHHTQILANLHCNDHMAFNDGTCCSSPEHRTMLQSLTYTFLGICCILGFVIFIRRYKTKMKLEPPSSGYILINALAKIGLIMAYFYLCDRTNFFMKENKYYSSVSFWLPLGYIFALGVFFTEDSRYTKVLHRDQSEEWKGWMQLVLLIYNMTGASENSHIRNHVQILISAYFFLSGYGHFYYLWHRTDAGVVRFFQMLFRLNFLPVLLCLCMNRPYQFYSFAPLISFWFLLVYLVLIMPPRVTATSVEANPLHYLYLVLKMVGLFSLIIILFMSEVFFEKVFVTRPWKALFVTTDDDIHEWWVRWKLNRYSMCYGVIFGLALVTAQRFNLVDDSNHSNLMSKRPALALIFLSLLGLSAASAYAFLCPSDLDCDEVHSYSTFVPIVSYLALRNVSGILRTRYSTMFAWFGKISLELCICQYHIWLAADSHGVLVFVPGYPVLNVLITSFIFVCAAHEIHKLTGILMPYAVPSDWRLVLRNFFIFLMILVPIGIHDGMF